MDGAVAEFRPRSLRLFLLDAGLSNAQAFGANAFMVIASTVMGGLMVEAGQKYGISGRVARPLATSRPLAISVIAHRRGRSATCGSSSRPRRRWA